MACVKPYSLRNTLTHPLARMLPIMHPQLQVYRLAEKHPPAGDVPNSGPVWETANFVLAALETKQARINLQRMFTLMGLTALATVNTAAGGFRVQFFDQKKQRRFADRGVLFANHAGNLGTTPGGHQLLREPYVFDQPDSQIYLTVQNMESSSNTVAVVFFGHVLRFNEAAPGRLTLPGGPVASIYSEWGSCPQ